MFPYELDNGTVIVITLVSIAVALYWWNSRQYYKNYWKKRGILSVPTPGLWETVKILRDLNVAKIIQDNYRKHGKLYGTFQAKFPTLVVGDPDLLKDILVKDFHVFHSRRDFETGDPISDNMVNMLMGEDWKRVRTIITPAFTSKRMRMMGSIINECSSSVIGVCEKHFQKGEPVDCKGLFGCFTMDVIARSAFGTKIDSASNPENEFVKNAKSIFFEISVLKMLFFMLAPQWLLKKMRFFAAEESEFFRDVALQVIKERKETGRRGNDILQILMDCANEKTAGSEGTEFEDEADRFGSIVDSNTHTPSLKYKTLSEDELLAQCVLFFAVGYETSGSTLTFLSYCLALHPEWQEKVIAEVDEAFRKHGEMSYDAVNGMKILDAVLSETMRVYPIVLGMERKANEDYELGETGAILEKGTIISIPAYAMHHDEEYFPDPEVFNPERFLNCEDSSRLHYVYQPFGIGPRNCLGMRFALLEIKMVMANILRNFRLKKHTTTKVPLEFKKGAVLLTVTDLPLSLEKRTDVP